MKKIHKAGSIIGFILLVLGFILTTFLIFLLDSANSLPKILVAGPCFISVGIAMLTFPGGSLTLEDMKNREAKLLWSKAPLIHRIVWVISVLIGLIISFKIMQDAGFL